jgi:hypothetical protein
MRIFDRYGHKVGSILDRNNNADAGIDDFMAASVFFNGSRPSAHRSRSL